MAAHFERWRSKQSRVAVVERSRRATEVKKHEAYTIALVEAANIRGAVAYADWKRQKGSQSAEPTQALPPQYLRGHQDPTHAPVCRPMRPPARWPAPSSQIKLKKAAGGSAVKQQQGSTGIGDELNSSLRRVREGSDGVWLERHTPEGRACVTGCAPGETKETALGFKNGEGGALRSVWRKGRLGFEASLQRRHAVLLQEQNWDCRPLGTMQSSLYLFSRPSKVQQGGVFAEYLYDLEADRQQRVLGTCSGH
jgi:hypothetical protein